MAKKKAARKTSTKKASTKKTSTKKKAATKKKKAGAKGKPATKSEILNSIAEDTGLAKRDVDAVFESMADMIEDELRRGPGVFNVPGLMKIVMQRKPATKSRKGINPFTGEEITIKAKPARNVVKVRPLKGLKEMV